jgi:hypothetical protein
MYGLASPFLVMAAQNPVEMDGTYPLPEAQRDRQGRRQGPSGEGAGAAGRRDPERAAALGPG